MTESLNQNIIAFIWDFDKTLIPNYMQSPLFKEYQVEEQKFWKEVSMLESVYKKEGIQVNQDTIYLNHILHYVRNGQFKGLSNSKLRELGKKLDFFPGIPQFFDYTREYVKTSKILSDFDLRIEHYIVSTGMSEMIRGSIVFPKVDGVWGCEFIDRNLIIENDILKLDSDSEPEIFSMAYWVDNTSKTKAIFEINKGANKYPDQINVNQIMPMETRRIPFENMIYIADGPSDIPAFSVIKKEGGKTMAVYQKDVPKSFKQVKSLLETGRVDMIGEADYSEGSTTWLWLIDELNSIAEKIINRRKLLMSKGKQFLPGHING